MNLFTALIIALIPVAVYAVYLRNRAEQMLEDRETFLED